MTTRRSLTLLITLLLPGPLAWGYSYSDNRGLLPLGELEAFMANTGLALSGSTGATAFNPAGLASITKGRVSLSANTYMGWRAQMHPLQTIDGVDLDFTTTGVQAVPNSFVSTWRSDHWTSAFSVLIPHQLKLEDATSYSSAAYPNMQYSRTNFFQLMMVGLSTATHADEYGYDIGVGCFYTMYQTAQMSSFTGNTNQAGNALIVNSFFRADISGLMCNLGLQKQASENLRWGFAIQSPFARLSRQGRASQFVQDPNNGLSVSDGPKSVDAEYRLPMNVGLGFEWRASPAWILYADGNYQMSDNYLTGDLGGSMVDNKATARLSLGAIYKSSDQLRYLAGLASNPGSPNVNDDNYSEDFTVGTFGASWTTGPSNFGVGAMLAQSHGSKNAPIYDAALTRTGTKKADVQTNAFAILVSSGYTF